MSDNPYGAPQDLNNANAAGNVSVEQNKQRLYEIAKAQRFICLVILTAILFTVGLMALRTTQVPIDIIGVPVQLLLSVLQLVAMYRLGRTVYDSQVQGLLMAGLACIPCLGLIALLVANGAATTELQKHGYRVGLLGADLSQFD